MPSQIKFYAQFAKVQTLADGGIRFTLDLPESAIIPAAEAMAFQAHGIVVDFVGTAREKDSDDAGNSTKLKF